MNAYAEKLQDPRWQKKRLEIMERDQWACRLCFSVDKPLHVHHTSYQPGVEPWEYPNEQLTTLCKDCHAGLHRCQNPPLFSWDDSANQMLPGWPLTCPACGAAAQKDKGTYSKCRLCGARYGWGVFVIPDRETIDTAKQDMAYGDSILYPALLTGDLRDEHGWSGYDMFRLCLCLRRMKTAGRDTSAARVLLILDPGMDMGGSVHGVKVECESVEME